MRDQKSFTVNDNGKIVPYNIYKPKNMQEYRLDQNEQLKPIYRLDDNADPDEDSRYKILVDPDQDYVPDPLVVDDKGVAHDLYHMDQPDAKSGRIFCYSPLFTDSKYLYVIALRFKPDSLKCKHYLRVKHMFYRYQQA